MTRVVNVRYEKCDVKCHRHQGKILPVPHPSCCGNPFYMATEEEREDVVRKFEKYFYERLSKEQDFKEYVHSLIGKILGCFCKEKDREVLCHVDIIKDYLDSLERNTLESQ